MTKVVYLKDKRARIRDEAYEARLKSLSKYELLEEMVEFEKVRAKVGSYTHDMVVRGKALFEALKQTAVTPEFENICDSYIKMFGDKLELEKR
jgi:hypothetical protein